MLTFGTAGVRGRVDDTVTPEAVARLCRAVAAEADEVVIARDGRTTGPALLDAAVAGLLSGGANVVRLGVLPTPALAFASQGRYGLMVTASHNPPSDNGIKVFEDGREIADKAESRIEQRLASGASPRQWQDWGAAGEESIREGYQAAIEDHLEGLGALPRDLSVVLDCGTGTAGLVAPGVLRHLGATVRTLNGAVDGTFPARQSKPTPETIETLSRFVGEGPADLGFAFDGDADRLVVVDATGEVIHEDTILAILAEWYVDRAEAADPVVVTTPNASERIDARVEDCGGTVVRTPLGQLREGIERATDDGQEVVFAAEPWKHIHPEFGPWIDGILSASLLTALVAAHGLHELRAPIRELPYRKESVPCPDEAKSEVMAMLEAELPEGFPGAERAIEEGIRLSLPETGWILVRESGTEPKIRLYAEGEDADELIAQTREIVTDAIASVTSETR